MSAFRRTLALIVFFGLVVAGFFLESDGREFSSTSFGDVPRGYRAAYELLRRLDVPVTRSFLEPATLEPGTLWLIDPPRLCSTNPTTLDGSDYVASGLLADWVRRGGTLVVFLEAGSIESCRPICGLELPSFDPPVCQVDSDDQPGQAGENERKRSGTLLMTGPLAPSPRRLEARLGRFAAPAGWNVALDTNGRPFVVEQSLGEGRVAVVADARTMNNRSLDRYDASLFLVDLVRTYGAPTIDEWMHGFRAHDSLVLFLLRSPALATFCGVALLAAALAWYGTVVPPRTPEPRVVPPSLDGTLDALATAYAATADYPALHDRYRLYALARLRHHLGLPTNSALDVIVAVLERRRLAAPALVLALFDRPAAMERSAMIEQMRQLDQLIQEAKP